VTGYLISNSAEGLDFVGSNLLSL
ncbi:uncharacterized protein METZ01_LOCUS56468, partial [marine metagenome]